jgi:hypothetical protein
MKEKLKTVNFKLYGKDREREALTETLLNMQIKMEEDYCRLISEAV